MTKLSLAHPGRVVELRPDHAIGCLIVGDLEILPIHFEFFLRAQGDVPHQHEFTERTGVVEMGAGRALALAGAALSRWCSATKLPEAGHRVSGLRSRFNKVYSLATSTVHEDS